MDFKCFETANSLGYLISDHFANMTERISLSSTSAIKETSYFIKFILKLIEIGKEFEENLFEITSNFQKKIKKNVEDEKLCEYFQLVINSVLKFGDSVQRKFDDIENSAK